MRQKVFTEEELMQRKIEYMKNTKWFCDICNKIIKSNIHNKNIQIREKDSLIADLTNKLSYQQ